MTTTTESEGFARVHASNKHAADWAAQARDQGHAKDTLLCGKAQVQGGAEAVRRD